MYSLTSTPLAVNQRVAHHVGCTLVTKPLRAKLGRPLWRVRSRRTRAHQVSFPSPPAVLSANTSYTTSPSKPVVRYSVDLVVRSTTGFGPSLWRRGGCAVSRPVGTQPPCRANLDQGAKPHYRRPRHFIQPKLNNTIDQPQGTRTCLYSPKRGVVYSDDPSLAALSTPRCPHADLASTPTATGSKANLAQRATSSWASETRSTLCKLCKRWMTGGDGVITR